MRIPTLLAALWAGPAAAADPDGFTPLFNGRDLAGWTAFAKPGPDGNPGDPSKTWAVVDGTLRCTGSPHGYLATVDRFADYDLRVEWRYPAGATAGNSGVLLHCGPADAIWPASVEAQLRAGRAGDFWLNTPPATDLTVRPEQRDAEKARWVRRLKPAPEKPAGEWNLCEVACRGGAVAVRVNGELVNEAAGGTRTEGRIALQSEGTEVHFKDIAVRKRPGERGASAPRVP